ncbi:hypothetical protein JHK82_040004 [Glycine max]|nr:hypothetical protein JHK82_040004 [Glycine max]KAG5122076.1 hypothetical protein JHK84_040416 [Glycine max]
MHLLHLSEAVHDGVASAGMVPFCFNTIGVSGAISMGTPFASRIIQDCFNKQSLPFHRWEFQNHVGTERNTLHISSKSETHHETHQIYSHSIETLPSKLETQYGVSGQPTQPAIMQQGWKTLVASRGKFHRQSRNHHGGWCIVHGSTGARSNSARPPQGWWRHDSDDDNTEEAQWRKQNEKEGAKRMEEIAKNPKQNAKTKRKP